MDRLRGHGNQYGTHSGQSASRGPRFSQSSLQRLASRGRAYWSIVIVLTVAGVCIGKFCEDNDLALRERYWIYQSFLHITPWKATAYQTAVVLIGEEDYWKTLEGRSPVSRRYIASLLRAVDACSPRMIALDFDLKVPPRAAEDDELLRAIDEVSHRRPVILPVTLRQVGQFDYQPWPQIYSGYHFSGVVRVGHIQVFDDVRPIPVGLHLKNGERQDSFSEAIVRLVAPSKIEGFKDDENQPFATFLPRSEFVALGASSVLAGIDRSPLGKLYSKIVIVSGDWGVHDIRRRRIDDHETPVGRLTGSLVQANYIEALLSSRTYRELNWLIAILLEVILVGMLVVLFALNEISWVKFIFLCMLSVILCCLLLDMAGFYYDFYFPLILLAIHGGIEAIKEMWIELHVQKEPS
jgi:CHASE2 domain-containing sensor protein